MTALSDLQPVLDEVSKRFAGQIGEVVVTSPNEVDPHTGMQSVAGLCAYLYRKWKGRLVSLFAEQGHARSGTFYIYYVFALDSLHGFIILRIPIGSGQTELASLTNAVPAVNWQEREIQDMFGLRLIGHPNPRRCVLHDDWPAVHPLRKDFPLETALPRFEGERHKFIKVEGEGVFQVPVGPVHAGIIEPGHFLFSVAGEPVLHLQIRLFYTHKGTEKLFENLPINHGIRLAESISGDSSFAHATAFCQAVERAANAEVPARARALRTVCLELERIYNHVADIGAIANDVAFVVANMHAMRLKERVLRLNEELTGNRLLRGMVCLGGVRHDWEQGQIRSILALLSDLERECNSLDELIRASSSTIDRLEGTGVLTPETALDLGVVGVAGRASGFDGDLRRDHPYAGYQGLKFTVPVYTAGDVLHRMRVRFDEVGQAVVIIRQILSDLPSGSSVLRVAEVPPDQVALGYVEGWRGEILHWIHTLPGNRLARCKIKDPSLQNWPALSQAIEGNIIPDFPVVNKSFNLSIQAPTVNMFEILRKSISTGIVTTRFPDAPSEVSNSARGRPEIDFRHWRDARPAATVCPTGAIALREEDRIRTAALDLGKCIFCGLCAEVDTAIRMTNVCQLARTRRDALKTTAEYELNADGTHVRLVGEVSIQGPPLDRTGAPAGQSVTQLHDLGETVRTKIARVLGRSLHIREVDAGSCNGCEVEIVGLNSPVYDIERFGIHFVASPRHADMLLVTGPVTRNMELALRKTYDAMSAPRLVVAVGACGCSGGIFGRNYATVGGVDSVLPVDVYIPGCPPNPYALLHGILMAVGRIDGTS